MDDLRDRKLNSNIVEDSKKNSDGLYSKQGNAPSLIDAEGLQKTLHGLSNMALVHEIALNKEFKLKKPDKSSEPISPEVQLALEAKEKYWEKVDEILMNKDIKECKQTVLDLIDTLKTMLHGTLLPHNVKMKEKIDQELDLEKLTKQIDNDAFDFVHLMNFILDTLAALCCPIRDQEVVDIRNIDVPSKQVRKTIDLMENMNLDMANFIISQSRNHIVQNCVTYERNKFASFIELQCQLRNDPVKETRDWIMRHAVEGRTFNETIAHAFLEVLDWDNKVNGPETLALDWTRFALIRDDISRVIVIGALVAALHDYGRIFQKDNAVAVDPTNKQVAILSNFFLLHKLQAQFDLLITGEEATDPQKLEETLERCCVQAIRSINEHKIFETREELDSLEKAKIPSLIRPVLDSNHPVRKLYTKRVKEWLFELGKDGITNAEPPQNLQIIDPLITKPVLSMSRLIKYNRDVFDVLYREIYDGNCPPTMFNPPSPIAGELNSSSEKGLTVDPNMVKLLAKLKGITETLVNQPSQVPQASENPTLNSS